MPLLLPFIGKLCPVFPAGIFSQGGCWLPGSGQERSVDTHTQSPRAATTAFQGNENLAGAARNGGEHLIRVLRVPSARGEKSTQRFGNALVAGETSRTDIFHGTLNASLFIFYPLVN